jgi:hypothetical protein
MTLIPFAGARLKVARADVHIAAMLQAVEELDLVPHHPTVEGDGTLTAMHTWTVQLPIPPSDISLIVGDAVHNLRSSLDLMMSAVMLLRAGRSAGAKFPFAEDMSKLKVILRKDHDKAGQDIGGLIRSYAPVKIQGNKLLRALHDLDIIDKHRIIISTLSIINSGGIHLMFRDGSSLDMSDRVNFIADKDGKARMIAVTGNDPGQLVAWKPCKPTLVFADGMPLEFAPITQSVMEMREMIVEIIDAFEHSVS